MTYRPLSFACCCLTNQLKRKEIIINHGCYGEDQGASILWCGWPKSASTSVRSNEVDGKCTPITPLLYQPNHHICFYHVSQEIEAEMARTQKNKATNYHLGTLKAKLAKLRNDLLIEGGGGGGGGREFKRCLTVWICKSLFAVS